LFASKKKINLKKATVLDVGLVELFLIIKALKRAMLLNVAVRYLKYTVTVISIEPEEVEALSMEKTFMEKVAVPQVLEPLLLLLLLLEVDC
jgi:hypothetical protein